MRCPACSLVWLSHPPKPAEMHLHYTDAYHRLISGAGENSPVRWRDRKAALRPYKQSGTMLDLAAARDRVPGVHAERILETLWSRDVRRGRKKAERRSRAHVFVGDILDAPFRRNL